MKQNFDYGWLFALGEVEDANNPDYDDRSWRQLNLPHDWSIEAEYSEEAAPGRKCAFLPGGIGWYRKHFDMQTDDLDDLVFVVFDGVYMNSEIWVNGHLIGGRAYGYSTFKYEISRLLKEKDNVIAVRVDNEQGPSGRWYTGSGIYRHTWLDIRNKLYISDETFVYSNEISENSAKVIAEIKICNCGDSDEQVTVKYALIAENDVIVAEDKFDKIIESSTETMMEVKMRAENPNLWSVETPNLYQLRIELVGCDGTYDTHWIQTGIRDIDFHEDKGFLLNGRQLKLKGVCNHHDAGPLGAAVPDKVLKHRLIQLKEMGCNAIRTSHNPFAPEFYNMCDQLGIMVMNEIFDGWHEKADADYGGRFFDKCWKEDVTDFVIRDRNHPCVIIWCIGNETGDTDIHGISDLFHEMDPTRLTTGGQIIHGVDVAGFNGPSEMPGYLEQFRVNNQDKKIVLTEYPHTYQTRGVYRTKTWWRDYNRPRHDVPDYTFEEVFDDYIADYTHAITYNSSYDNHTARISHREAWRRVRNLDYVAGMFMWTGFDYLGESFGWPFKSGNNGLIDLCGFPKDIYYFYKSQWQDKAVLHLLPHWTHPGKEDVIIPVVAYTNCESVELYLNDKSLGSQKNHQEMALEWYVPYSKGELKAIGWKNGERIEVCVKTAETPYVLKLESDTDRLVNDGVDMAQVSVAVVDRFGTLAPDADSRIHFHVCGNGSLKALGNGDPHDLESHKNMHRKVFRGLNKAFIESRIGDVGVTLIAGGILGKRFFCQSTVIQISVAQVSLSEGDELPVGDIMYTLDGSDPINNGQLWKEPITITESTSIRATVKIGNEVLYIWDDFIKGNRESGKVEYQQPRSEKLLGTWGDGDGKRFTFYPTGVVDEVVNGEKCGEHTWWYEEPIDAFENEVGDIDNGEIQYLWYAAKIRLQKDGSLRIKLKDDMEGTSMYIFKKCSD